MVDEDIIEADYTIEHIVNLVENDQALMDSLLLGNNNHDQDEEHIGLPNKNDIEFKAIKLEKKHVHNLC